MNWKAYPFLRITIALILGIFIHEAFIDNKYINYLMMLFGVVVLPFYFSLLSKSIKSKSKIWIIVIGLASFVLMGYFTAHISYLTKKPLISHDKIATSIYYSAIIDSKPVRTKKITRYKVKVKKIKTKECWQSLSDQAILYFTGDTLSSFDFGDELLIKGNLEYIKDQTNPHAFNYAFYLRRQGIYLFDFVEKDDFLIVNKYHGYSIKYLSLKVGDYFEEILQKYISNNEELSMVRAMVIGRREEITAEMESAYQSTGTSHILAVSGLHVGVIFLIFSSIFKSLKYTSVKWIYYSLVLFFIWSFAFITGSSPSVLRASLMISIVLIAEMLLRKSNIYNSILIPAFALLLINPNLLFSVSFQLSYIAVFGIIYLYQKIYGLIYIENKIINFFWKISVLSISAQIATFPLTIYYFHQFPALFIISNLVAIPTAGIVIMGSLLLFSTSFLSLIPDFIGQELEAWVYFYNQIMLRISSLQVTAIDGLYLKQHFVFMIIACLVLIVGFIETRKLYLLRYFTFVLLLIAGVVLFDHYEKSRQKEIVFYDVQGKSYVDIFLGKECFSNVPSTAHEISYNISPNRKHHLISSVNSINKSGVVRSIGGNRLLFHDKLSILFLEDIHNLYPNPIQVSLDYLVIGKNSIRDLEGMSELLEYKYLILDATISERQAKSIINRMNSVFTIFSIRKDGALAISI